MSIEIQEPAATAPPTVVIHRRQPSAVADATLRAYLEAEYVVHAAERDVVFRVGHASPDVHDVLQDAGVMQAALITAFNPRSEPRTTQENQAAHRRLLARLDREGYKALAASGRDPKGRWSTEPSVFILGMDEAAADTLGREFEQNAYVLVVRPLPPRLIVLR